MAYDPVYGHSRFLSLGPYLFSGQFLLTRFQRVFQGGISRKDAIVAFAGGGKASATPLFNSFNRIGTCATGGDSVLLPKAIAGSAVFVRNDGAQSCNMFGKGTDTIDAAPTANATALAAAHGVMLMCVTAGAWVRVGAF